MALLSIKSKKEFEEKVINNKKAVLVDFWAIWCPPCRAMTPILESTAKNLDEIADIVKVNIEDSSENNQLAVDHGVQGIPTMVIYESGKEFHRIIGTANEQELTKHIKKAIEND